MKTLNKLFLECKEKISVKKVMKVMRGVYALSFLFGLCPELFFGMDAVTEPMDTFNALISTAVTMMGEFILLWAISEWGLSLQAGNGGMMEGNSIKKLLGGFVMIAAPDLATLFRG